MAVSQEFFKKFVKTLTQIQGSLSVMRTSEAIVENAAQLLGARGASLMLYDHGTKTLKSSAACGLSQFYLNKGPVEADKSLGETLQQEPVVILDATQDERIQYKEEAAREGIKSIIGLPLQAGNMLVGALRLYFDQTNEPDLDRLVIFESLANLAGLALKKSFYFSSFQAVLRSIHSMNPSQTLEEVLQNLVQSAARGTYAKGCVLWLLDDDNKTLKYVSGFGLSKSYLDKGPVSINRKLDEAETGKPLIICRIEDDDRIQYPAQAVEENIVAMCGFPVEVACRIVGALRFYFQFEFEPDEDDQTYMALLADQVGLALEKDQLFIHLKNETNALQSTPGPATGSSSKE
ncbi:MAG: GAF domain-containing protein [Deltaproteobacteria bacterium]|nr:GAF domain-containing protein [Deltaproteobacteria bacterium]